MFKYSGASPRTVVTHRNNAQRHIRGAPLSTASERLNISQDLACSCFFDVSQHLQGSPLSAPCLAPTAAADFDPIQQWEAVLSCRMLVSMRREIEVLVELIAHSVYPRFSR